MQEMWISDTFQVQMASIMEVLTKTAVAEMTKLVVDGTAELRLEICRSQAETEALKSKLLLMEREFSAVRRCGEGTLGTPLNISYEVPVCDEFREAQRRKGCVVTVERALDERLRTDPGKDDQNFSVGKNTAAAALNIKHEPVDWELDSSESLWLDEDGPQEELITGPKRSQSRVEQNISMENSCGTLETAAANHGKGPFCVEEELLMRPCSAGDSEKGLQTQLKQELEGTTVTPACSLLGSTEGLELQCILSEATSSGKVRDAHGQCTGTSKYGDAELAYSFSPPHYSGSQRLCSKNEEGPVFPLEQQQNGGPHTLPVDISAAVALLGSPGECSVSTPCKVSFNTSLEARSHWRMEGQEEFICTHCGKTFPDVLQLRAHEDHHGAGKRFSCSECGKVFADSGVLEKHLQIRGKCFSQISSNKSHQITLTREKHLSCTVCNETFDSPTVLLQHHLSVHAGVKCIMCKLCAKLFDSAESLEQHCLAHHREKRFRCTLCGKGFSTKSNLKSHQSVHTGEKLHRCNECGKCFTYLCNLKTHQRIHTGEKPFSCMLCGRSFSQKHVLQRHMLSHRKE